MTEKRFKQITHRCFTKKYPAIPFCARSTGHYKVDPYDVDGQVKRNFIELFWAIEGVGQFIIMNKKYTLHPGEVCFYLRGDLHQVSVETGVFHYRWMAVDGPMADQIWHNLGFVQTPRKVGPCPEELFVQLESELKNYSSAGVKLASATAFRIWMLASSPRRSREVKYDYVEQAKLIIDTRFRDPDFNIGLLSDRLQINRSQLCRKFHVAYGVSPVRYLIDCRIQFGLELLRNSNDKIIEVAAKSGFDNPNYFSKSIKKYTGLPVRELRG